MAPTHPVHIALLDDHPLFRQGLRYILQALPYVEAVTEASTLPELLASFELRLPEVLLLDLQMPHMDGPAVAQELLSKFPELKIVVLSMHSADKFITQMMKLGARSYLPKDAGPEELIRALEEVLTTGYHFTPRISRALMRGVQQPTRQQPAKLLEPDHFTPREEEVLRLICEGHTAAEIARHLFISKRTVEGHWQRLLEKTGTRNVAGLVVFAAKHGMLEV
ncbi:response regulator transcription factor [Hymenobacter armeniacus]|uniref:Response regulator transcription factor n=1 Tax=Hymenobacter armeniacus TaxID=2771358 RepID=A0ABR8JTH4_9BACT|nr:response regulator transcription factor [Hymenobacter armeniacus]MBD2722086.1 response regulator transcription factor [Hymenobacter armeniacus]